MDHLFSDSTFRSQVQTRNAEHIQNQNTAIQKIGVSLFCFMRLHLFDQKYSKNAFLCNVFIWR